MSKYLSLLNDKDKNLRLYILSKLVEHGEIQPQEGKNEVNNHIHTTYSFSPYTPTMAATRAYMAGLSTAGIMDHDSISGAREFLEAGKILGLTTTIGAECRVSMADTPLSDKRINNPDQNGIAYMALHGVPHTQIDKLEAYFKPYLEARNRRNRKMVENINDMFKQYGITLDFDMDVLSLSQFVNGGSITERHILYALSLKVVSVFGKGAGCIGFLKNTLGVPLSDKTESILLDENNEHYAYDLLGVMKSDLISKIYVDAAEECPPVREMIAFAKEIGAISAYAYLGDVGQSVTGDKKAQTFEDSYLDLLFKTISELGFDAVTYMPSRNTPEQLEMVMGLCDQYNLFQISGEDINSPRQSFICEKLQEPRFSHLIDSTWALIGHEKMATKDLSLGMFAEAARIQYPNIRERVSAYKGYGLEIIDKK
ncbi:MAG: PHP domain-containing protein [Ruminococcaceae bacterium]|nr:PHP domain-containing protein [Oscillospiraceae bacterium]